MAINTPVRLNTSGSGSPMRPNEISALFTGPLFCSRITQAVERTSSEVQNGISTSINSRLAMAGRAAAITAATGYPISRQSRVTLTLISSVRP